MNKKIKNIIIFILSTFAMTMLFVVNVFAAEATIKLKDIPSVTRGKETTITVKVEAKTSVLSTANITFSYDPNMIEFIDGTNAQGGGGSIVISGTGSGTSKRTLSYSMKFKTLQAGETYINIESNDVRDKDDNIVNITHLGQSKINIVPLNKKSKNANLKTLEISPGELNTSFDPGIDNYNIEVNSECNSLSISALPEDQDSKVTITGNEDFKVGNNYVKIDVVAPNGVTKKTYTINVEKLDTVTLIAVDNGDIINGVRVTVPSYTVTILTIPEGEGVNGYFKYDNNYIQSKQIESLIPDKYQNTVFDASQIEAFLFYGTSEKGGQGWYRFDRTTETVQRYIEEEGSQVETANFQAQLLAAKEAYDKMAFEFNVILAILIISLVFNVILIVVIIVSNKSKNKNNKMNEYDDEDDDYEDSFYSRKSKKNDDDYDEDFDDDNIREVDTNGNDIEDDEIEDLD